MNQLLARRDIPEPDRVVLLRGLIRALGARPGSASELPPVIKFTSWNVLFVDIIRAAFPDCPWLFLYREPLEVLASHLRHPARWLTNDGPFAGGDRAQWLASLAGLGPERRCAALLAEYGRAALAAAPAAVNLLNYHQCPAALCTDVPARFGLHPSSLQQTRIADASRIYSKDVSRSRVFDPESERRGNQVTDRLREADEEYTRPVYAALEARRLKPGA